MMTTAKKEAAGLKEVSGGEFNFVCYEKFERTGCLPASEVFY